MIMKRFSPYNKIINYMQIYYILGCKCSSEGEELLASSSPQVLSSPDYPAPYCELMNCSWIITAPAQNAIKFRLLDVRTENNYDAVILYNGVGPMKSKVARYCYLIVANKCF